MRMSKYKKYMYPPIVSHLPVSEFLHLLICQSVLYVPSSHVFLHILLLYARHEEVINLKYFKQGSTKVHSNIHTTLHLTYSLTHYLL